MSHFKTLVIVPAGTSDIEDAINKILAPFDENMQVAPYKRYPDADSNARMAEHYNTNDPLVLATHMQDWRNADGGVDDQGLFYWSTYNPDSKWDWWVIGGRYHGYWGENNVDERRGQEANIRPVMDIGQWSAYAIVTPLSEWHATGRMGWFGVSFDEQEKQRWDAERAEVMSGHKNDLVVICDLHI
jgi:hypothetical protein